ncbi:MAG TPA: hypothetical protein VK790_01230 [Solirubrobacteraceae bacterium]|jgi:hypothetical protein|nr:hypothetical protein [Solirubrobacteraceae bacterium]
MPDQPNLSAGQEEAQFDRNVLDLMFTEHPWPWTVSEIGREMRSDAGAEDAVGRLAASGLLHQFGEFVFPTRTAGRAAEIEVGTT